MNQTIRPLRDLVLCEALPTEDQIGSILVPDSAKGRGNRAKVIDVGRGRVCSSTVLVEPAVKVGDVVIIDAYRIELVIGEAPANSPYAKPGARFLIYESNILGIDEGANG